jgi:hypothetical protein
VESFKDWLRDQRPDEHLFTNVIEARRSSRNGRID